MGLTTGHRIPAGSASMSALVPAAWALVIALAAQALAPSTAHAGMPRGAIVSANEQESDPETGVTIARGNAEITIEKSRIVARADAIEINPAAKQIHLKGRALVRSGSQRYEGESIACTLDFNTCATSDATLPSADPATVATSQGLQQPLPPPAALGAAPATGAAVTSPR